MHDSLFDKVLHWMLYNTWKKYKEKINLTDSV